MIKVVCIFLLFCAAQMIAIMLAFAFSGPMVTEQLMAGQLPQLMPSNYGLSLLFCEILLSLLLWRYLRRETSLSPSSLLTGSMRLRQLSAVVGVPVLNLGLSLLLSPFDMDDLGIEAVFSEMITNPFCLLLLCVVGPLTEEIVFRSGMLRLMRLAGLSSFMAVGGSALAFAVVHGNLVQAVPALLVGMLLGYLYLRTGNLKLCLPAHIANNTVAVLIMAIPAASQMTDELGTGLLLLLGSLYVLLGLALSWRALK